MVITISNFYGNLFELFKLYAIMYISYQVSFLLPCLWFFITCAICCLASYLVTMAEKIV